MYEIIGPGEYKFMVGRMGWTIAKIWQSRNAQTPDLTEEEMQTIMEKFHKSWKNVQQAARDTWARYTRQEGRGIHVVKRVPPKLRPPFRTTRHRWSSKGSALADDSGLGEAPKLDGQFGQRGHSDESSPKPAIKEPSPMVRVRKTSLERRLFEDVRRQCLAFVEGRPLVPGQHVTIYKSRIVSVEIEKLTDAHIIPDLSRRTLGHRYVVWVSSEIPNLLKSPTIMSDGSSAREAMTQALRRLEDELCPSA